MPAYRWPIGASCPQEWIAARERRSRVGVPEEVALRTTPEIAGEQLRALTKTDTPSGVVPADAGYGNDREFRRGVRRLTSLTCPVSKKALRCGHQALNHWPHPSIPAVGDRRSCRGAV